jgi:hypothetical protein
VKCLERVGLPQESNRCQSQDENSGSSKSHVERRKKPKGIDCYPIYLPGTILIRMGYSHRKREE